MLSPIIKFLKALAIHASPNAIAMAVVIASIMGLTPLMTPHNLLLLFILLFFNIHLTTFMILFPAFAFLGLALDPLFDQAGYALLTAPSLNDLWTGIYNTALGRNLFLNNTVVTGSLLVSLLLSPLLFIVSKIMIRKYRERFIAWLNKTRIMSVLKSSKVLQMLYQEQTL